MKKWTPVSEQMTEIRATEIGCVFAMGLFAFAVLCALVLVFGVGRNLFM